jgi:cell division protein FtsB
MRMDTDREHSEHQTKQSRWGFRGMTVRDWLQLLIVPLALVVIGFLFTVQQDPRQQRIEDQRAEAERELAEQRAQDEALQAYLSQMGSLLLEKNLRGSDKGSEVRSLARARTLTVLGRLDPSRKKAIMRRPYRRSPHDRP